MPAKNALAGLAAVLAACGGTSPSPCTSCLNVAGSYQESAASAQIDCGDRRQFFFNGGSEVSRVVQQGSALTLSALGTTLPGVLHTDGSASFGPVPALAQPVGGSGDPTPGKLYLEGFFTAGAAAAGAASFAGTYVFIADPDSCELDARATWRR